MIKSFITRILLITLMISYLPASGIAQKPIHHFDKESFGPSEIDTSMYDIFGRRVIYRDLSATKVDITESGRVVIKICINRAGDVTYVELIPSETTITDNKTLKLYLKAARGYKFEPDLKAPKEQCGKLSFKGGTTLNMAKDDSKSRNVSEGTGEYDGSGDGVYGRKIVYRDLSDTKAAISVSGKVVTKICINRDGNVTFVELIPSETTIADNKTLKLYLKAARGYKFQPDLKAPKEQCGKLSFKLDNSIKNK
jgi:hypothetical protein